MLLELLILFITVLLIADYFTKKKKNEIMHNISGPVAYPLLGSVLMYIGRSPENILKMFTVDCVKYGSVHRIWIFNHLEIFIANPSTVMAIVNNSKHLKKSNIYDTIISWLGTGLLTSSGDKWHGRRKVITPTFHFKILEQFVDIFDQQGQEFISQLKKKADGISTIDIQPYICRLALDIIAETAMGTKVNAQRNPNMGYVRAVADITELFINRYINPWHRFDFIFKITAPFLYLKQNRLIRQMYDFTESVIQERRRTLEKKLNGQTNKSIDEMIGEHGEKKKMALLDVLLQSSINGKPLSNEDIREEVNTFMFAGHDTTTSGICFTLYLLSRHAAEQQKVFDEIRTVIGDDPSKPTNLYDLNNLKYLECVIKETLRLYPAVPVIGRKIEENINLDGKNIPAGSDVIIGIYVMHRDPQYFPDPDKFIPERHLEETSVEKINLFAYMPFSAGPRNCIGQKFAMLEMKSTISKVLRHFELRPLGQEVRPAFTLTIRSANGVNLGLKPRVY